MCSVKCNSLQNTLDEFQKTCSGLNSPHAQIIKMIDLLKDNEAFFDDSTFFLKFSVFRHSTSF